MATSPVGSLPFASKSLETQQSFDLSLSLLGSSSEIGGYHILVMFLFFSRRHHRPTLGMAANKVSSCSRLIAKHEQYQKN